MPALKGPQIYSTHARLPNISYEFDGVGKLLYTLILNVLWLSLQAQAIVIPEEDAGRFQETHVLNIGASAQVWVDSSGHDHWPASSVRWRPLNDIVNARLRQEAAFTYWIRIDSIFIDGAKPLNVLADFGGHREIEAFLITGRDTQRIQAGFEKPISSRPFQQNPYLIPLSLNPGRWFEISVLTRPFVQVPYPMEAQLKSYDHERNAYNASMIRQWDYNMYMAAVLLILLFLSLFAGLQYLQNRDKAFLYYALYLLGMFSYFLRMYEYQFHRPVLWGFLERGYPLSEALSSMISWFLYTLFAMSFLSLTAKDGRLYLLLRWGMRLFPLYIVIHLFVEFVLKDPALSATLFTAVRVLLMFYTIYAIIEVVLLKHRLGVYLAGGTIALFLGGSVALLLSFTTRFTPEELLRHPYFYMQTGVLVEALFFAMGLGFKLKLARDEKNRAQEALIQKTREESAMKQQLNTAKIQALKAQMNPHFLFNAMNSIQHFITINDKGSAIRYLSKFAKLIRQTLDHSTQEKVSLAGELEVLKNYMDLEGLRLAKGFDYEIKMDAAIDPDEVYIPQLLIQPVVENAIVHGFKTAGTRGNLQLSFALDGADLRVVVRDNGIGRAAAAQLKRAGHTSRATEITSKRLTALGRDAQQAVETIDLVESGKAVGTEVRMRIPYSSRW